MLSRKKMIIDYLVKNIGDNELELKSLDGLCSHLKISKKTIYKLFDDKKDLIKKLYERIVNDISEGLTFITANNTKPELKIQSMLASLHQYQHAFYSPFYKKIELKYSDLFYEIESGRKIIPPLFSCVFSELKEEGVLNDYSNDSIFYSLQLGIYSCKNNKIFNNDSLDDTNEIKWIMFSGLFTEKSKYTLKNILTNNH